MSDMESKLQQERSTGGKAQCTSKHLAVWGVVITGRKVVQVDTGAHIQIWRALGNGMWELESKSKVEEANHGDE